MLKLSIITPSFNQAQFLERTIQSVLSQEYPDIEYIIIDGGSTDGSVEIIKKYEKQLSYWISEKDSGQSDALNKGFKKATGDIVGWQNSDDLYLPGAFNRAVQCFLDNPSADVIFGNRKDIDEHDQVIGETRYTRFSPLVYRYDGLSLGTQAPFWRRALFSRIGYLDISLHLAMDYDFFMRAAVNKARFIHIPFYLGAMRRHKAAKTEMFLNTPPHQKECAEIDRRHGRKIRFNLPLKLYSLSYRMLYYILQGDLDYALRGIKRRWRNKSILGGQ